mgnify:CR=1 FL=1
MFPPDEFPRIISVDDHVVEPAGVWQDRLPEKFKAVGPRMERRKIAEMSFVGGVYSYREANAGEDGTWCDWWFTEDLRYPMTRVMAAAAAGHEPSACGPRSSVSASSATSSRLGRSVSGSCRKKRCVAITVGIRAL